MKNISFLRTLRQTHRQMFGLSVKQSGFSGACQNRSNSRPVRQVSGIQHLVRMASYSTPLAVNSAVNWTATTRTHGPCSLFSPGSLLSNWISRETDNGSHMSRFPKASFGEVELMEANACSLRLLSCMRAVLAGHRTVHASPFLRPPRLVDLGTFMSCLRAAVSRNRR